jgi:tRNA A37 methylthiotransferase MiaB
VGADMPNQISDEIKEKRATAVKEISKTKYEEFIKKNIGQTSEILIEKHPDKKTGYLKGVTRNYLTVILDTKDISLTNTIQTVKINEYKDGKIYGELIQI